MILQIEAIHPDFIAPTRATEGSAGYDFYAVESNAVDDGQIISIPLGCKVAFNPNFAMLLTTRSGHGRDYGAGVPSGYGLIDSDYRGELTLILKAQKRFSWSKGDRIAQAIFIPVERPLIMMVGKVPPSARGEGGFGSTGK